MADSFAHNTQFVGAMNGSECSLSYVVHTEAPGIWWNA